MSVRVKNIYLEVPEYDFCDENKAAFIGRIDQWRKIKRKIMPPDGTKENESTRYKGAYLIAGYRGIGKSSLVRRIVDDINNKEKEKSRKELIDIPVFLSQGDLTDFDLLRQMFIQLNSKITDFGFKKKKHVTPLIAILVLLIIAATLSIPWIGFRDDISKNTPLILLSLAALYIILITLLNKWYDHYIFSKNKDKIRLTQKLNSVNRRIHSSLEVSEGEQKGSLFNDIDSGSSILTKVLDSINSFDNTGPYRQTFEKITTKELEFEIKEIIHRFNALQEGYILFIIDELDKLEPEFNKETEDTHELGKSKYQTRRDTVATLLANLKSFIHTSEAKFVFIGGAEMYDASLADIADRESFYSSIFHEVIYIDSFFKDSVGEKKGMSQMTEDYVIRNLLHKKKDAEEDYNTQIEIDDYFRDKLSKITYNNNINFTDKDKLYIIYHLRRFIIFLTYRSNGSPKKLKELFESYIIGSEATIKKTSITEELKPNDLLIAYEGQSDELKAFDTKEEVKLNSLNTATHKKKYLRLKYMDQYHVGLLYNIVTPYLLKNQRHFKIFSDRNLYLSAFLIDHVLKFHRSAFSWRELELMPDIILGNKGPNLRESMNEIISHLSEKYIIRETINAMFQFKFRSRAALELRYVSKISDENAAAFNFTYDESYHLKTYFKRKLKQKRILYSNDPSAIGTSNHVFTLAHLNSTIADLHYYDEEYKSAIRYYNDCLQGLHKIISSTEYSLDNHQKIQYIRNRLLLSLCLEKMYYYDTSYSTIRSSIIESNNWDFKVFNKPDEDKDKDRERNNDGNINSNIESETEGDHEFSYSEQWESPYKRMQLFLRPHLALLACIEKGRSDGITESNLRRNIQEYTKFMGLKPLFPLDLFKTELTYRNFFLNDKIIGDYKRVQTLLADYYQNVGSILFYKNRNFNSIHQKGSYGIWFEYLKIKDIEKAEIDKKCQIRNTEQDIFINGLGYMNIQNIRNKINRGDKNSPKTPTYFFPSYSCTFYYATAIGHILSPYLENLETIFENSDFSNNEVDHPNSNVIRKKGEGEGDKIKVHNTSYIKMLKTIEHMVFKREALHLLSGKTAQSLALILSKQADAILGSIGNINLKLSGDKNMEFENSIFEKHDTEVLGYEFWNLYNPENKDTNKENEKDANKEIEFDHFFSLNNIFYLNLLSYRAYMMAGLYYDALFKLKKCLYIINTHCKKIDNTSTDFVNNFTAWLQKKSYYLIETYTHKQASTEKAYLQKITEGNYNLNDDENRLFVIEKDEIRYLCNQIELKTTRDDDTLKTLITRKHEFLSKRHNYIDNVYTRIQELKYNTIIQYDYLEKIKGVFSSNLVFNESNREILVPFLNSLEELDLSFDNMINMINTYGYSYVMTYAYTGNLYKRIYELNVKISTVIEKIENSNLDDKKKIINNIRNKWKLTNGSLYKSLAIDFFTKSVNLHSEGIEYKSMIKDMYILEDDYNDSLTHFCAALERSLINTGIIENKLETLLSEG